MTNYEIIKKTSHQTPNQYIMFGRSYDIPQISILPDLINQELIRVIDPKIPNKTYYVDDGKYTIRIISKFVNTQITFEFSLRYNDTSNKIKNTASKGSYEDYLESFKYYMISAVIVIVSLFIFSIPILKSLL